MADIKNPERRGFEPSGQQPEHGSRFKEQAGEAGEKVRETAATVYDRVSHQAHDIAQKGKHRAAEAIGDIATSIRAAGHKLHDEQQEGPAQYVDRTAEQFDRVARYLEEHEVEELVDVVEDSARKHPAVFLGIALVVGMAVARFVRSSARRRPHRSYESTGRASYRGGPSAAYAGLGEEESFLDSETEPEPGGVEGISGGSSLGKTGTGSPISRTTGTSTAPGSTTPGSTTSPSSSSQPGQPGSNPAIPPEGGKGI